MSRVICEQGGSTISKRFIQTIKKYVSFLLDKRICLGIGIGLVLGVIFMFGYKYTATFSDSQIEERARSLGMIYENESKAILKGEN